MENIYGIFSEYLVKLKEFQAKYNVISKKKSKNM